MFKVYNLYLKHIKIIGVNMIVVVGGIKGGSGKTMLATNLTVMRAMAGKRVLLVDADEQHSSSDWAAQRISSESSLIDNWSTVRLAGKNLYAEVKKMMKDYDDVIVDVGGRDTTSQRSALSIADVLLSPVRPRSVDIWTLDDLQNLINQMSAVNHSLSCYSVINQADPVGSDNDEAFKVLSDYTEIKCLPQYIGMRKGFANAMTNGMGVTELKNADPKAVQEITTLYEAIYNKHV